MKYADFKLRLVSSLLDFMVVLLVYLGLFYYVVNRTTLTEVMSAAVLVLIIILNPLLVFNTILLTYYCGGSIGKLLLGLRVTAEDGKPLSFKRVFFRQTAGYSFSWVFFGLGYLAIMKDEKKQAWHDKAVGSVVTAKDNYFVVGLMIFILSLFAAFSLLNTSLKTIPGRPYAKEFDKFMKQIEVEQKEAAQNITW